MLQLIPTFMLCYIYAMLHLFGPKTLLQLKGFTYYRKNPSCKVEIPIQVLYLKCSKFLSFLIRQPLKTAFSNFISKSLKGLLPSIFNNWFKIESHSHDTKWSNLGYLKIPSYRTKTYGRHSMFVNSTYVWNNLQNCHENVIFHQFRANELKEILITFFLYRYN